MSHRAKFGAVFLVTLSLFTVQSFISYAYTNDTSSTDVEDGGLLAEEIATPKWENDFSKLVDQAVNKYPDSYAEAGITSDRSSAWIFFKGSAPTDIVMASKLLPVNVEVKGGAKSSQNEIQSAQAKIYYKAQKLLGDGIVSEASAVDGTINIFYNPKQSSSRSILNPHDISKMLFTNENSVEPQFKVNLIIAKDISSQTEALYGGGHLSSCTTAFSATKTGETSQGLLSAAHCTNSTQNYGSILLNTR